MVITNLFSVDFTADAINPIYINVPNVINANVTRPSTSFFISTQYDTDGFDVDDSTGKYITVQSTFGLLDQSTTKVVTAIPTVGAKSTYNITFKVKDGFYNLGFLFKIIFFF